MFISTMNTPESFIKNGYPIYSEKKYHKIIDESNLLNLKFLINNASVVIIGAASDEYIKHRISNNKLTFRYSEHMFKKHAIQIFDPRRIIDIYKKHFLNRNKNLHMLCASGFLKNELSKFGCYKNKIYKWGYFIKKHNISFSKLWKLKSSSKTIRIVWIGRFIKWKHPETVINLAKSLIAKDISIQLDMIGDGYLWNTIHDKVVSDNLQTHISFKKGLDNNKVLKILILLLLLSTSDIGEGWGFSIGEAMRSGCAVIASDKIGSVPYLIRKNFNGLSYDYNNFSQ